MSRPEFGIKHYAGEVIYEVWKWNKTDDYAKNLINLIIFDLGKEFFG